MIQLEFTAEEAQNLLNLLDAAVRAQGLNAAQLALPLAVKVQRAMNDRAASSEAKPEAPQGT